MAKVKLVLKRISQAAGAAALLETMYATIRAQSFYLIPTLFYAGAEFIFFILVFSFSSFVVGRISTKVLIRKGVFCTIAIAPSVVSYLIFYENTSYYEQNGKLLIADHSLTGAGILIFTLDVTISIVTSLIATTIYFRSSSKAEN